MSLFSSLGSRDRAGSSLRDDARGAGRRLARTLHGDRPAGTRIATILGGAIVGGLVLGAGAVAAQWLRERGEQEPDYDTLRQDGVISLRRYRALAVATATVDGPMKHALDRGFRRLFGYISGRERGGEDRSKIAMTVPVIAAAAPADHPGDWLIRFVMPSGKPVQALPAPEQGVRIEEVPARVVAAIRFPGRVTGPPFAQPQLDQLRSWLGSQGLVPRSEPEFAAYNSPFIPGALRRNEWWIAVDDPAS